MYFWINININLDFYQKHLKLGESVYEGRGAMLPVRSQATDNIPEKEKEKELTSRVSTAFIWQ